MKPKDDQKQQQMEDSQSKYQEEQQQQQEPYLMSIYLKPSHFQSIALESNKHSNPIGQLLCQYQENLVLKQQQKQQKFKGIFEGGMECGDNDDFYSSDQKPEPKRSQRLQPPNFQQVDIDRFYDFERQFIVKEEKLGRHRQKLKEVQGMAEDTELMEKIIQEIELKEYEKFFSDCLKEEEQGKVQQIGKEGKGKGKEEGRGHSGWFRVSSQETLRSKKPKRGTIHTNAPPQMNLLSRGGSGISPSHQYLINRNSLCNLQQPQFNKFTDQLLETPRNNQGNPKEGITLGGAIREEQKNKSPYQNVDRQLLRNISNNHQNNDNEGKHQGKDWSRSESKSSLSFNMNLRKVRPKTPNSNQNNLTGFSAKKVHAAGHTSAKITTTDLLKGGNRLIKKKKREELE